MPDRHDWQAVYPDGLTRAFDVPERTLPELLAEVACRDPARVLFVGPHGTTTYHDLHVASLRAALRIGGAERSAVVVRLPNGPEFAAVAFGAYVTGRPLVPTPPDLPLEELGAFLRDTEAGVLVATEEETAELAARFPEVRVLAPDGEVPDEVVAAHDRPRPGDVAVLQYTSGTTGGRKAACMTHRNLVANALQNDRWFGWTPDDVVLGALPPYHTWGLSCVLHATVAAGARAVLLTHFDAPAAIVAIREHDVTVAYGSATMFHRLLDAAGDAAPAAFATLRYVKAGAMLVGGDLQHRWRAAVPDVPMVNGYGLTEASPEVCNNPPHAVRPGTVGVPLPGTELRLVDPEDPSRDVGDGPGELLVRGPQVTSGYWRRPDATARAIDADGWLRTGDVARFDEAGYVVIVDRLKDLIKFRGYSVVPAGVEAALRTHTAVRDAVVVGVPDARDGEVPVAFVEPVGRREISLDEVRAHLADRVLPYEVPRDVTVLDAIPRNDVGKPLRRVLRQLARSSGE